MFFPKFNPTNLNWDSRSNETKDAITKAFNNAVAQSWHFQGNEANDYYLANLKSDLILKKMIQSDNTQKNFYVLDIGAGNYGYSNFLTRQLNQMKDLSSDVKVHIISIGAGGAENSITTTGMCIQYNLSRFNIENLIEELSQHPFFQPMNNPLEFDLIVSRWTFIHLVDPLGTFLQAYRLLRFNGLLLTDGFDVRLPFDQFMSEQFVEAPVSEDDYIFDITQNIGIIWLLLQAKISFLFYGESEQRGYCPFVLRKNERDHDLQLPLEYTELEHKREAAHHLSDDPITAFSNTAPLLKIDTIHARNINSR